MKYIITFGLMLFLFSGCATTTTNERYAEPGPHYLKAEDKEGVQAVGNIVGMIEGGFTGLAIGMAGSLVAYNSINGHLDGGMLPWLSLSSVICTVVGGVIGWNVSYGMVGGQTDEDKKRERQKQLEEKYKDLYRDKNPQ